MINLTLAQIAYIYNAGYNGGHDDTVEGCAFPINFHEWETYRIEEIRDFFTELCDLLEDMNISLDGVSTEIN